MPQVEAHVWRLDVAPDEQARLLALLDADEQDRAGRFRFERDRRRFIIRRGRLRELLAARTGERPETLRFAVGIFGKPELDGGGPRFSLSHREERMMVALADAELGCDIERIDESVDWRPLAERLFAPAERDALTALPEPAARQGFFDCWARKEAFVKALGQGLSYPLDAFTVSVDPALPARIEAGAHGWAIVACPPEPGYAGAIVARDDGSPIAVELVRHAE